MGQYRANYRCRGVETMEKINKRRLFKLVSTFIMADGGAYKRYDYKNAYFAMNMTTEHLDYIDYVKSVLENITSVKKSDVKNPCKSPQTNLTSKTHPVFTKFRKRIYDEDTRYKGLDWLYIKRIDWEMLAFFYMADGSLNIDTPWSKNGMKKGLKNLSFNVTLNMKRLTYGDIFALSNYIYNNLGVTFRVQKQRYRDKTYYYLRLSTKDVDKFMDGIRPYIFSSFLYKTIPYALPSPPEGW